MKYAIHFAVFFFIGWPALFVGYVWAAIRSGFDTGVCMHDRHEDAAITYWLPKKAEKP